MRCPVLLPVGLLVGLVLALAGATPALVFTSPAPYDDVAVPWDLSGPDAHAVVHISPPSAVGDPTAVFALEDAEGGLVMYAVAGAGAFLVTDGYDEDGAVRLVAVAGHAHWGEWYRFDVRAGNDNYHLTVGGAAMEARSLTSATAVRFADDATLADVQASLGTTGAPFDVWRPRVLPGPVATTSFAVPLDEAPWSADVGGGGSVIAETERDGHHGVGRLAVASPRLPMAGAAYTSVAVPPQEAAYLVEASYRPWAVGLAYTDGVPDHQAVIAGVSGSPDAPTVHWALAVAPTNDTVPGAGVEYDRWSLFLLDAEGHRTRVGGTWGTSGWHHVQVLVDEAAGALTVRVDDADPAFRFLFDDLPPSERLATGDVWTDDLRWTGGGRGYYDDLAVTPWSPST